LKIDELLSSARAPRAGPSIAANLVRLSDWLASIQDGRSNKRADCTAADGDVVEQIANSLIANATGKEQKLLSKSLQEALYYAVGFDTDSDCAQLKTRLSRYLDRCGAPSFIRRFLSLFFFNLVRFETAESFLEVARSSNAFEKYIEGIDRVCQQTVASVWKSFEKKKRRLDLAAAAQLVSQIEQRLRGN